jgi:hypothetical protein
MPEGWLKKFSPSLGSDLPSDIAKDRIEAAFAAKRVRGFIRAEPSSRHLMLIVDRTFDLSDEQIRTLLATQIEELR